MAILDILIYPDQGLRVVADPVRKIDNKIRELVSDMFETMYDANGIGLAATQVNVHQRVVVMDLSENKNEPRVFINPTINEAKGEQTYDEGCLSIPEYYAPIKRAEFIKIAALDEHGKEFELEAEGLLAVCIQHEIDHLNGKVFVDYLSRLKQDRVRKKLLKRQRSA